MKKFTLLNVAYLLLAIVAACWLIWRFYPPAPLAAWTFYGKDGREVRGYTYPPALDSVTGMLEDRPEIPGGNGVLLSLWPDVKQCILTVKAKSGEIRIARFSESRPFNVQIEYIDSSGAQTYLRAMPGSGVYFWHYPDPARPGDTIGWRADNIMGKAIPIRYRNDALIDGTRYTLQNGGRWLYQKYRDGKVVNSQELEELPSIPAAGENDPLMPQAERWLDATLEKFSHELAIPIVNGWLETDSNPCQQIDDET
ncbi:hypothetical protein [Leminorella grimontii]|uniref:hypothetical protein n=1 Tax=Leminorella grimontii TaxID=82981 RepID=UPI00208BFCA5|nr:hypothetical protein [Leminorella grimontii]GKX59427.1 hypothetical protein SOASR031_17420 [Leminorella grimontii]